MAAERTRAYPAAVSSSGENGGRQMPRVVVAHDFMETYGGAERITAEIAEAFPGAPVVAIMGRRSVARMMGVEDRFVSLLRPRPWLLRNYRLLTPLFPLIVDRLRLPPADVVVSSSYAFAHRLSPPNGAVRVCYAYSPMRFAWAMEDDYRATWAHNPLADAGFRVLAAAMRRSDRRSAQGVDVYATQVAHVAEQIERFYGRSSQLIGAPVDCEAFHPSPEPPADYYLFSGRLIEPYKKVTLLVEAFNRLGHRLIVAGDGPERQRLEAIAGPNIEFAGHLETPELVRLMQRCLAGIFPSEDDFGLVPVEVMACGRPVIAYGGGGALYTVEPGKTGEFFPEQTADALVAAVEAFRPDAYDSAAIRAHALRWDRFEFRREIARVVDEALGAAG